MSVVLVETARVAVEMDAVRVRRVDELDAIPAGVDVSGQISVKYRPISCDAGEGGGWYSLERGGRTFGPP